MAANAKIDWYTDDAVLEIEAATLEILIDAGFAIEAEAKANIVANDQVDTGAMVNAVYTRSPVASGYGSAASEAKARRPDSRIAPEAQLPDGDSVLVHAAMEYAIYQEDKQPFLYPALEAVQEQIGGMIQAVARSRGLLL